MSRKSSSQLLKRIRVQPRLELQTITDPDYKGFDLGFSLFMREQAEDPMDFTDREDATQRRS